MESTTRITRKREILPLDGNTTTTRWGTSSRSKRGRSTKSKSRTNTKAIIGKADEKMLPYSSTQFGQDVTTSYDLVMRGNGCYDPDVAVGGHQPLGFDQYMALYNKYYVKSSTIKVDLSTVSLGANNAIQNNIFVSVWADTNVNSAVANLGQTSEICAAYGGVTRRVGDVYDRMTPIVLSKSTKAVTGKGFETETSGDSGHDPDLLWYWHVVAWSSDGTLARKCDFKLDLMYDTLFYEGKALGQS